MSVRGLAQLSDIDRTKAQRLINGDAPWTLTELEYVCSTLDLRVSTVVAQAERHQIEAETPTSTRRLRSVSVVSTFDDPGGDQLAQIAALEMDREGGQPEPGSP